MRVLSALSKPGALRRRTRLPRRAQRQAEGSKGRLFTFFFFFFVLSPLQLELSSPIVLNAYVPVFPFTNSASPPPPGAPINSRPPQPRSHRPPGPRGGPPTPVGETRGGGKGSFGGSLPSFPPPQIRLLLPAPPPCQGRGEGLLVPWPPRHLLPLPTPLFRGRSPGYEGEKRGEKRKRGEEG